MYIFMDIEPYMYLFLAACLLALFMINGIRKATESIGNVEWEEEPGERQEEL